jgi:hypothetical protein
MLDAALPPLTIQDSANPSPVQQARAGTVAQIGNPIVTASLGLELQLAPRAHE